MVRPAGNTAPARRLSVFSHDRTSVSALVAHRPLRRPRRSDQRAGPRLPLFGSHRERSGRRRRRHDHAARRSVAAGSPRARRGLRRLRARAADGGACARQRSAGRGRADPATLAAAARCRSGRGGRTGEPERQIAIATRANLPCSVSAAIAEVGCAEACLVLLENEDAETVPFSLDRIVQRFGHLAAIRDVLLARDDLPAATRQALVVKLSETLADFVTVPRMAGARIAPAGSPARPARRPPSRSPPIRRRARCAR